jgi:RNase adaptor protein for sRNA GlmZ degradation
VAIIHDASTTPSTPSIVITTFGYLHDAPPPAHITLDLRVHFKDPHVAPELRYLTAHDEAVRAAVLTTPGISALVNATVNMALAYLAGPSADTVTVAVGCAGGRHRAATVGMELARVLTGLRAAPLSLTHRDLHKDVVDRPAQAAEDVTAMDTEDLEDLAEAHAEATNLACECPACTEYARR